MFRSKPRRQPKVATPAAESGCHSAGVLYNGLIRKRDWGGHGGYPTTTHNKKTLATGARTCIMDSIDSKGNPGMDVEAGQHILSAAKIPVYHR